MEGYLVDREKKNVMAVKPVSKSAPKMHLS